MSHELTTDIATRKVIIREKDQPVRQIYVTDAEAGDVTAQIMDWRKPKVIVRGDMYEKSEVTVRRLTDEDREEMYDLSGKAARARASEEKLKAEREKDLEDLRAAHAWAKAHPAEYAALLTEVQARPDWQALSSEWQGTPKLLDNILHSRARAIVLARFIAHNHA